MTIIKGEDSHWERVVMNKILSDSKHELIAILDNDNREEQIARINRIINDFSGEFNCAIVNLAIEKQKNRTFIA
jgi:hypothetical protein